MSATTEALTAPAVPTRIPTLREYTDEQTRADAAEHGMTYTEIRALRPMEWRHNDWWDLAVQMFQDGADFSVSLWRSLTVEQQRHILRTPRAQRDVLLTRKLIWRMPTTL